MNENDNVKYTVMVDGIFRLETPLHISDPAGNVRYVPGTDRLTRGDSSVGFPATATRHAHCFGMVPARNGEEGVLTTGLLEYPVLPANGLRGKIRRAAAAELEDVYVERGERVSWQTYQGMHSGAVTGIPSSDAVKLDQVQQMRDHVFVGTFGGGSHMQPSRLRVSTGVPPLEALYEIGLVPERWRDFAISNNQAWRLCDIYCGVRNDDLASFLDQRAENVVDDYNDVMLAQFAADTQRRATRKKSATADSPETKETDPTRSLKGINAYQYVIPGVPFYVRFEVVKATEAQCGMFLAALLRMLRLDPRGIGGKSALGFGRFRHELRMVVDGDEAVPFNGQCEDTSINIDNPIIASMMTAYESAAQDTQPSEIGVLMSGSAAA